LLIRFRAVSNAKSLLRSRTVSRMEGSVFSGRVTMFVSSTRMT
jgi:hypothetical protein